MNKKTLETPADWAAFEKLTGAEWPRMRSPGVVWRIITTLACTLRAEQKARQDLEARLRETEEIVEMLVEGDE